MEDGSEYQHQFLKSIYHIPRGYMCCVIMFLSESQMPCNNSVVQFVFMPLFLCSLFAPNHQNNIMT